MTLGVSLLTFASCVTAGLFCISAVPLSCAASMAQGPILGSSDSGNVPGLVSSTLSFTLHV